MPTSAALCKKNSLSSLQHREATGQSIIKAMDSFAQSMNRMHDTVMVPSRLRDMEGPVEPPAALHSPSRQSSAPSSQSGSPLSSLVSTQAQGAVAVPATDLYAFYRMLDNVHQELVCGSDDDYRLNGLPSRSGSSEGSEGGIGSSGSPSLCDSDFEGSDNGLSLLKSLPSGLTSDFDEPSRRLEASFKFHLRGLFSVLHQLKDTADHVSQRYQADVTAQK